MTSRIIENAKKIKELFDENQKIVAKLEEAGGLKTSLSQSDKLGFDWELFYVNNKLVNQVYVEQENPIGIESNPFVWEDGITMIQNAFYVNGDTRKVWTGESGAIVSWDDDRLVLF